MEKTLVEIAEANLQSSPRAKGEDALKDLENDLAAIEKVDLGVERAAQERLYASCLGRVYPIINPSFLSMKSDRQLTFRMPRPSTRDFEMNFYVPRFAIFSLNSPNCRYSVEVKSYCGSFDEFNYVCEEPEGLPRLLEKAFKRAVAIAPGTSYPYSVFGTCNFAFSTTFSGVVPAKIKQHLSVAKKVFGKHLYLISEAGRWNGKTIPQKDPLIIGIRNDACFLVDAFDMTPMEEYARREFTSRKLKSSKEMKGSSE